MQNIKLYWRINRLWAHLANDVAAEDLLRIIGWPAKYDVVHCDAAE